MNECVEGTSVSLPSINTKKSCTIPHTCVNSLGGFYCCEPGFENKDNALIGTQDSCTGIYTPHTLPSLSNPSPQGRPPDKHPAFAFGHFQFCTSSLRNCTFEYRFSTFCWESRLLILLPWICQLLDFCTFASMYCFIMV